MNSSALKTEGNENSPRQRDTPGDLHKTVPAFYPKIFLPLPALIPAAPACPSPLDLLTLNSKQATANCCLINSKSNHEQLCLGSTSLTKHPGELLSESSQILGSSATWGCLQHPTLIIKTKQPHPRGQKVPFFKNNFYSSRASPSHRAEEGRTPKWSPKTPKFLNPCGF